jgi:hypothetical protein
VAIATVAALQLDACVANFMIQELYPYRPPEHFQLVDHAQEAEVENEQLRIPDRPAWVSTSCPIGRVPSCGRKSGLNLQRQETSGSPFRQAHESLRSATAALGGGPRHFFERSSLRAAPSIIRSVRSFFNFAFSSSSALGRLASRFDPVALRGWRVR